MFLLSGYLKLISVLPMQTAVASWVRAVLVRLLATKFSSGIDGAGRLDCDSRRAVGLTKTIRGVYMTQLNRLQRLAALSAPNERSLLV